MTLSTYVLVDCIDNAYGVECLKIHDIKNYRSSYLFNGASVKVTGDNEYALSLCRNKPSYPCPIQRLVLGCAIGIQLQINR